MNTSFHKLIRVTSKAQELLKLFVKITGAIGLLLKNTLTLNLIISLSLDTLLFWDITGHQYTRHRQLHLKGFLCGLQRAFKKIAIDPAIFVNCENSKLLYRYFSFYDLFVKCLRIVLIILYVIGLVIRVTK